MVLIPRTTPINPNKQSTLCFIYSSFRGSATKGHLAAIPIDGHPWQKQCLCQTTTGYKSRYFSRRVRARRIEECRLAATPSAFRHARLRRRLPSRRRKRPETLDRNGSSLLRPSAHPMADGNLNNYNSSGSLFLDHFRRDRWARESSVPSVSMPTRPCCVSPAVRR